MFEDSGRLWCSGVRGIHNVLNGNDGVGMGMDWDWDEDEIQGVRVIISMGESYLVVVHALLSLSC